MLLGYTLLLIYALTLGRTDSCHCFGDFLQLDPKQSLIKNGVLMLLFLLSFGLRALIAVLRKPKQYFTLHMAAFVIAYGLGLIHAYYTASVLRRNNASIYLAMVLAGLWYLSCRKQAQKTEPEQDA